jgi:DNA repair protein RadC
MPLLYIRVGQKYEPASDDMLQKHLRKWAERLFRPGAPVLDRPEIIESFLLATIAPLEHEVFVLVLLDLGNRLIGCVEISRGTSNYASIHSREVVKEALSHNASSVILAHNHTSGNARLSQADISATIRLRDALGLVDVRVIDHLVVGKTVTSLAKCGLFRP